MKRDEIKLTLELNDIIDELNSLNRVFDAQRDALDGIDRSLEALFGPASRNDLQKAVQGLVDSDMEGYRKALKRMMDDAGRTKKGVSDALL